MTSWTLAYDGFEPEEERLREALTSVGNGYFCTRGSCSCTEADDVHYPDTYIHATLRTEDSDPNRPFVTDGGHYTVDCLVDAILEPDVLQTEMKRIPGAVETGLFLGIIRAAVVGHADERDFAI
ncbi:MAG: ribose-5-phosphate isomerase A [Actinobacteria bacterium]|nr:ribose-5-phosphate isomerase A [Actinomycetota bacterium]